MIIDITGVELTPGNLGKDCMGNGKNRNAAFCCDECDYLLCCVNEDFPKICSYCVDINCPRKIYW